MDHRLSTYDVFLKFILEGEVKRIIDSEDGLWQEAINFGISPMVDSIRQRRCFHRG